MDRATTGPSPNPDAALRRFNPLTSRLLGTPPPYVRVKIDERGLLDRLNQPHTLREALLQLGQNGLLHVVQRRGIFFSFRTIPRPQFS